LRFDALKNAGLVPDGVTSYLDLDKRQEG